MTLENIESLWFLKGLINFCFGIHWLSSPGFTGPQAETKRSLTHLHSDERFLSSLTHCILVHSVYSIFEKTAGYVKNRCLQTHMPFRG